MIMLLFDGFIVLEIEMKFVLTWLPASSEEKVIGPEVIFYE